MAPPEETAATTAAPTDDAPVTYQPPAKEAAAAIVEPTIMPPPPPDGGGSGPGSGSGGEQPGRSEEEEEEDESSMTVIEHLEELRWRIIVSMVAVLIGSIAGWFLANPAIELLARPVLRLGPLRYAGPADGFVIQLKMSVMIGVALAWPVLLYQAWKFIAPGLTRKERRLARPFVLLGVALFICGCITGYLVLPLGINFLVAFQSEAIQPLLFAKDYLSFVSILILLFGAVFELPLVLTFLALLGVVSSQWLRQKRRYALFANFAAATIITPGADIFSPIIMGVVMCLLYELAIWLCRFIGK